MPVAAINPPRARPFELKAEFLRISMAGYTSPVEAPQTDSAPAQGGEQH